MRRPILAIVLLLGAIAGFGSGIVSVVHYHREHRAAFEQHIADVCVEAAHRAAAAEGAHER